MNRSAAVVVALAVCTGTAGTLGAVASGLTHQPQPAEDAGKVLMAAAEHLKQMDHYTFRLKTIKLMTADGLHFEQSSRYDVAVSRPNKLAMRLEGGMRLLEVVSDGQNLWTHIPMTNAYFSVDAPAAIQEALREDDDDPFSAYMTEVLRSPGLQSVLAADPVALVEGMTQQARHDGYEEIEGERAHRILIDHEPPVTVWISAADPPRLLKATTRQIAEEEMMMPVSGEITNVATSIFTGWTAHEALAEDRFVFTPPEGARQVAGFEQALLPEGFEGFDFDDDGGMAGADPNDLVGEPAPKFKLPLLAGGEVDLAEVIAAEKVIVLDFWATWCPPCVRGLPILAEVTGAYDPEKVVFYAINVQEDAPTIQRFLERAKLQIHVPMDKEGTVGELYHVGGIPQTVLIGRDGTVQAVHVGLGANLREKLKQEIDALLEGKQLGAAAQQR